MAQINPYDITYETECYAAVKYDIGFITGRLHNWKLHSLQNPDLRRTLSQSPSEVIAAFETREELEQWLADLYKEPEPKTNESQSLLDGAAEEPTQTGANLTTIGFGKDKLIISKIL